MLFKSDPPILTVSIVDLTVIQHNRQSIRFRRKVERPSLGSNSDRHFLTFLLVDSDPFHLGGSIVNMFNENTVPGKIVKHALFESQGRSFAMNSGHKDFRSVIRLRKNAIIEPNEEQSKTESPNEHRSHYREEIRTARFYGRDLVVRGQTAESHQCGYQDSHGDRKCQHPGQIEDKNLQDSKGAQSFAED